MESSAQGMLNSRYKVIKSIGDGTFAEVFLAEDLCTRGESRLLPDSAIQAIKELEKFSPDFEFMERDVYDDSHQQAVNQLKDLKQLFPHNDSFLEKHSAQNPRQVAIKIMKQNKFNDRDGIQFYALRELAILQTLQQKTDHSVQLLDAFLTSNNDIKFDIVQGPGQICIVMEYLPSEVSKDSWKQLIKGLNEIHEAGVMHRDVKPANIRVSETGTAKFFDFGISKLMEKTPDEKQRQMTKNCVTRCYRPPELFFGQRNYTFAVDVWSLGCTLHELFLSNNPKNQEEEAGLKHVLFKGDSDLEVLSNIFTALGSIDEEDWPEVVELPCYLPFAEVEPQGLPGIPNDAGDGQIKTKVVEAMLKMNPSRRVPLSDVLKQIQ